MHNIDSYSIKIKIKKKRWLLDLYVGNATWVTPYNKIGSILILKITLCWAWRGDGSNIRISSLVKVELPMLRTHCWHASRN